MILSWNETNFADEDAGMTKRKTTAEQASDADSTEVDSYLEWDKVNPAEKKLLLEEDTVYAEDLVQLGLSWQDFRNLVVRKNS